MLAVRDMFHVRGGVREVKVGVRALSAVEARPWGMQPPKQALNQLGRWARFEVTSPPTLHTAVACCNLIAWKQACHRYQLQVHFSDVSAVKGVVIWA
jgi:hypothetical protein